MSTIDYLKSAKKLLEGKHLEAAILGILLSIIGALPGILSTKLQLFNLLLLGPISLGVSLYFLDIIRGKNPGIERSFDGFKQYASSTIAYIISAVLIVLGLFCLIIPGIILALGLNMVFFILADNPEMEGIDAVKASWEKMKGHKSEYGMLVLLCILLAILGFLFFIVGIFYVLPIIYAASALFYEKNIAHPDEVF